MSKIWTGNPGMKIQTIVSRKRTLCAESDSFVFEAGSCPFACDKESLYLFNLQSLVRTCSRCGQMMTMELVTELSHRLHYDPDA
ncbi:hypothetical protein J1N35_006588 [Gossypium stocksii]|uniref:Uncharacterized protein n=1 Tax=Gossypium stocksii TaxID=47602 RepID=A0A9D3WHH0_9ROSI|nr:hypothetical protein J1N35_006588 [Gossypium stocksii]